MAQGKAHPRAGKKAHARSRATVQSAFPVQGYRFAGVHCGIKADGRDLALIVSDREASVAGVLTQSSVVGAPVDWCRARLASGKGRGIVVNSGISNVGMGRRGISDTETMASLAAKAVGANREDFYVASTGVIGEALPMGKIRSGIRQASDALARDGLARAAEAIMTTDTFAKLASRHVRVAGKRVEVAGIAKGSGMIQPNMATMLSFLVSDASASPAFLRRTLKQAADQTFNRVTVDGETSTSDTVLLFANGAAENRRLTTSPSSPGAAAFPQAVKEVSEELACMLARDGEGATKLITVEVRGARNFAEAERTARNIANSMLVKTAIFGRDPNWGRIIQAVGAGQVALDLSRMEISLCGVAVFKNGSSTGPAARRRAETRLTADEIEIRVHLAAGKADALIWTCDLSYDYVRINAEYTS